MKTLAKVTAAALFAAFVGCQENAVEPIVAEKNAMPVATVQVMKINEALEFKAPDGRQETVAIAGEVTYKLRAVEDAALAKEIPAAKKYDLTIFGKGQIAVPRAEGLAKPEVWTFAGNETAIVEDGARGIEVTFNIEGAKWTAHYHVMFALKAGVLASYESFIDFHSAGVL